MDILYVDIIQSQRFEYYMISIRVDNSIKRIGNGLKLQKIPPNYSVGSIIINRMNKSKIIIFNSKHENLIVYQTHRSGNEFYTVTST